MDGEAVQGVHPRWVRTTASQALTIERLQRAKKAFTTRRVPFGSDNHDWSGAVLLAGPLRPRSGDVVLATVERIGHHSRIELANGRRAMFDVGDEIIVTYADRYATDQFEAEIPKNLGLTNLVASGGIASTVISRHETTRRPTVISPIGLLADDSGAPLNISAFAIKPESPSRPRPRTVAVLGTAMNSGKTTTVGAIIRGLCGAGHKPGGTKVTGTGSGADYWVYLDAGAHSVADFTDAGLASTYRVPYDVVEATFVSLIDHLTNAGCTDIVIEIADGLFQEETARLIRSEVFRTSVDQIVVAAYDAMGAVASIRHVRDLGLPLVGASGLFTRSLLAAAEVRTNSEVSVWSKQDLTQGALTEPTSRAVIEDSRLALGSTELVIDLEASRLRR